MDVVDNGRGVGATERGVRAPAIVEVDERRQGSKPGGVGGVRPSGGPFTDEGPDEPLGLAVGLRPVGSRPGLPAPGEGGPVLRGAIRPGVVGHHPLDGDALFLERGDREAEGSRGTGAALVGYLDHDAPPAAIVDDDLDYELDQVDEVVTLPMSLDREVVSRFDELLSEAGPPRTTRRAETTARSVDGDDGWNLWPDGWADGELDHE